MQQIVALVIFTAYFIYMFIPLSYLNMVRLQSEETKQCLNLSVKVLANSLQPGKINSDELSKGYQRENLSILEVDKEKLLNELHDAIAKNCGSLERFSLINNKILFKAVVYYDRFYAADKNDKWSPPYFFTVNTSGELIYLNTKNDIAYYYDESGNKVAVSCESIGVTKNRKNEIIINKINSAASQYSYEKGLRNGISIQICNADTGDTDYRIKHSYFNVLDGITFFIVYVDDKSIDVNLKNFTYKNYNVAGYTLY